MAEESTLKRKGKILKRTRKTTKKEKIKPQKKEPTHTHYNPIPLNNNHTHNYHPQRKPCNRKNAKFSQQIKPIRTNNPIQRKGNPPSYHRKRIGPITIKTAATQ